MKRILYIFLCFIMIISIFSDMPAAADDNFLICAVENGFIEDLSDHTRATYIDGTIYVPYRTLNTLYGIRTYYNERLQQLLVYSLDLRMTFDMANSQTYDSNGDFFPPLAVRHADTIFIPIQLICDRFDLYFSYTQATKTIPAPIIRICASRPYVTDARLYSLNSALIQTIYENYQSLIHPDTSTPSIPTEPGTETSSKPIPKLTYLSFEGSMNNNTAQIMDTLADWDYSAVFFLPAEDPVSDPDLLRRIYANGWTIGLLLTDVPEHPETLLAEANEKIRAVLHTKLRLVCIAEGTEILSQQQQDHIIAAGFRLWDTNIDPDPDTSSASALYKSCRRLLSRTKHVTVIRLCCNDAVQEALPNLCTWLYNNSYSVLTMNEWDTPINKISEIR